MRKDEIIACIILLTIVVGYVVVGMGGFNGI